MNFATTSHMGPYYLKTGKKTGWKHPKAHMYEAHSKGNTPVERHVMEQQAIMLLSCGTRS